MMNREIVVVASIVVLFVSTYEGLYLSRYRSSISEMLGMMVGMTMGMMTGLAVGYFAGAASDMFVGNLVGMAIGLTFGITFGRAGGLMGIMDGGMGGLMGGMMGAMLGVMMQYLYSGWAVSITGIILGILYFASMVALLRLVQRCSARAETDPVCNMKVDPKTAIAHVFQNQTYHFCSVACKQSFIETAEASLSQEKSHAVAD